METRDAEIVKKDEELKTKDSEIADLKSKLQDLPKCNGTIQEEPNEEEPDTETSEHVKPEFTYEP